MASSTYWTLDVELSPEAEELWSLFCYEQGATGAQWLEEQPERLRMRYTFDRLSPAAIVAWPTDFAQAYPGLPPVQLGAPEEHGVEPWATQWREHFRPLPVGQRLLICPPWDQGEANPTYAGRLRIVIDPGQGFGTGQHASTALALELIEQTVTDHPPAGVLDVGTGSGILAAAACLLGVPEASAIDIDDRCIPEVRNNFALSGITAPLTLAVGGPATIQQQFPLVLANLTAPVQTEHASDLARLTSPGGHLILSGILTPEYPDLQTVFHALGMTTAAIRQREPWTALLLHRTR